MEVFQFDALKFEVETVGDCPWFGRHLVRVAADLVEPDSQFNAK
jgi:hypothetical protein